MKTLFLKELDKLYTQGAPEDDINERREEMERMREHVFNEADLNHDGLIRYRRMSHRIRNFMYLSIIRIISNEKKHVTYVFVFIAVTTNF